MWSHDGRELFYRNRANELMAIQFTEDPTFARVGEEMLFSMDGYLISDGHPMYDVSPDGRRFVMLRVEAGASMELIMVQNFAEELKQPTGN